MSKLLLWLQSRRSTIYLICWAELAVGAVSLFNVYAPNSVVGWMVSEGVSSRAVGSLFIVFGLYIALNLWMGRYLDMAERFLCTIPLWSYTLSAVGWAVGSNGWQAAILYTLLCALVFKYYIGANGND